MEYGTEIYGNLPCDDNYIKHVGYTESNDCIKKYFSVETVQTISQKVTQLTMGVNPDNRPIIVPSSTICSVMNDIYESYRPPVGDIYSRYIVPSGTTSESYVQNMIDQVIEVIVSDIRNSLGIEEHNSKLSIWTTVYGDFNQHQLRQHPIIKIRNKRPAPFQFHLRY